MKFIKFNDWLKKINEETKEERIQRELEAKKRQQEYEKYLDTKDDNDSVIRASGHTLKPKTTDEFEALHNLSKNVPDDPAETFYEKVYDNIDKIKGFHYLYHFPDTPKGTADANRIHELLWDCYDDGTSVEEATNMAIELLKKMNYVK